MKIKLNKKSVKSLSPTTHNISENETPQVGGGIGGSRVCFTRQVCVSRIGCFTNDICVTRQFCP